MRLIYVHPKILFESHAFWYPEFMNQSDHTMWIAKAGWNVDEVIKWRPDHIHFASRACPRTRWMSIEKLKYIRRKLPRCVITSYRGGVGSEVPYLEKLNLFVDAAFGPTDSYKNQIFLPACADPKFWRVPRPAQFKHKIIFIGRCYQGPRAERGHILKDLVDSFPITVVGNDSWQKFGIHNLPRTLSFIQNRIFYGQSYIGLNLVSEKYLHLSKYFSSRLTHMMMVGLPCFTPYQPNLEKVFKDQNNIIFYRSKDQLFERLEFYLKPENRSILERIAKIGQTLVSRQFNPQVSVKRVLSVRRKKTSMIVNKI